MRAACFLCTPAGTAPSQEPTCTGQAKFGSCDTTGAGRSADKLFFDVCDPSGGSFLISKAGGCGAEAVGETISLTAGQTVYALVFSEDPDADIAGFALQVTCGP